MLNLSDKDLDRLSQEAAQQHEPGDIIGPRFWEKLEARLDRDLGKVNPNPARGIRRLPYLYAPALLVILGVTYYMVRVNNKSNKGMSSGSPPLTLIKPAPADPLKPTALSSNPVPSDKSNSTSAEPSNTLQYPGTAGATPNTPAASARPGANPASAAPNSPAAPASANSLTTSAPANPPRASASANSLTTSAPANPPRASASANSLTTSAPANSPRASLSANPPAASTFNRSAAAPRNTSLTSTNSRTSLGQRHRHNRPTGLTGNSSTKGPGSPATDETPAGTTANPGTTPTNNSGTTPASSPRDLTFSAVRGPVRLTHTPSIDDSALRAFTLSSIRQPIHKDGLHINRSLEFGIKGGPDFASVNSVAGDRPGSTFGLTVDYQFANHWYVGSGLLFTRKIFAAAPQDYHVPLDYYKSVGMWMGGAPTVDYIKGRFDMLEIPLNLRYDFSTAGSTLFFASVGASSYLFTNENCNYFYNFYNRPLTKGFTYTSNPNNLFSTLNLSMGVETGISNSLSLVVAPYVNIPTRSLGFGQVMLSSVGIDFALRFAPVISRKR
jgi:hypothetical protein